MLLPQKSKRHAGTIISLLSVSLLFVILSCGGPSTNKNGPTPGNQAGPGPGNPVPSGSQADTISATIELTSRVVSIQPAGGSPTPLTPGTQPLKNGDSITADDSGEAAIKIGKCDTIYIYRTSHIKKDSCSKYGGPNDYCIVSGTGGFKHCEGNISTDSESATVVLIGTWASHTYVLELQLAVVLLFDGKATARAVTNTSERTLANDTQTIPEEHFWFSVPDNRREELEALNIGLEQRTPHPFSRLPLLLAKLRNLNLDSVAEQAINDDAISGYPLDLFRPPGVRGVVGDPNPDHDVTAVTTGSPEPTPRPSPRTPPLEGSTSYGNIRIGDQTTKEFSTLDGAVLVPGSLRIDNTNSFRLAPMMPQSNKASVAFAPTKLGNESAVLRFSDSSSRRYLYRLSGAGAVSGMKVSADVLKFNGPNPRFDRVVVTSTGDADLEVKTVSLVNDPGQRFVQTNTCKKPLKKNEHCEIVIEHKRVAADIPRYETDVATLSIANDAFTQPMLIPVSAFVLPALGMTPSLPFGPVMIPGICKRSFTVKNNLDQPVKLGKATLNKDNILAFKIVRDTCSDKELAAEGKSECMLEVSFEPWDTKPQAADLVLPYRSPSTLASRTVELSGIGKETAFSFSGTREFGPIQLNTVEKVEKLSIQQLLVPTTQIQRVEIRGPAKDDFKIRAETCTANPNAKQCEVTVAFKPNAEGLRYAQIVLLAGAQGLTNIPLTNITGVATPPPANATPPSSANNFLENESSCGDEFHIKMDGIGYARWRIREGKNSLCFGAKSVFKGTDPKPRTLQLHLDSESQQFSPRYQMLGENPNDFSVTKKCDTATKTCEINIVFAPKATDKRRAIISLAPDEHSPPIEVELYGRGKSPNVFKRFGRWVKGLFTDEAARSCRR